MMVADLIRNLVLVAAATIVVVLLAFGGLVALGVVSAISASAAGAKWPGPHTVDVLSVLDADTVSVRMRDGPCGRGPCPGQEVSIRVRGVDAPEVHLCRTSQSQSCARCDVELVLGRQATAEARRLLTGAAVRVRDIGPDPYFGRFVGTIEILSGGAWRSYGNLMIERNLAVPYDPDRAGSYAKTKPWCARDDLASVPNGSARLTEAR